LNRDHQAVAGLLARAALEAASPEELHDRAWQVLGPVVGHERTDALLQGTVPTPGGAGDGDGDTGLDEVFVEEVAAVLTLARGRLELARGLREVQPHCAESEHLTRLLLDSAGEGLYAIDLQGRCTAANREAVRLLGYDDEQDLLGHDMHELAHHTRPDGTPYPEEECRIFQAWREGRGVICEDEVLFRKDGTSFPVEYRSYPILVDGEVQGSVLTFFDITARKAAERELQGLHEDRRLTALALHDNVVQALATASYARSLGEEELSARALAQALAASQALVSQLLADRAIDERVLLRSEPSLDGGRTP
jgi:PAS domain S-box-containing protein